ncbi:MAG: hotdog fold thioesterase [Hyphomicrobiaceae bacterium]|nr:hotdog fold thioesterase [Hyphomicrobiaceae bacterium]
MTTTTTPGNCSRPQDAAALEPTPEYRLILQMADRNPVFQHLGLEVVIAQPGHTRFAMPMRQELTNTFGTGHGGILFTLADMAFGFACNSSGERAMTASAAIDYLAPAPVGKRLIADAREVERQGRNVFYDVVISVDGGDTIAIVRGRMKVLGGPVIAD